MKKMRIYSNTLDVDKFKKDFVTLYRGNDQEQVLDKIVELVNESEGSISSFLRKVDSIENEKVQKLCRQAAIAQMYKVGVDYYGCRSCYVETSSYGEAILIKLPKSTVVLSKYGDMLINEGEIWTQSGMNYGLGFFTRKVIDGQVSQKYGFIDTTGVRVLPCIFDNVEGHLWEAELYYGSLHLSLRNYGNKDTVDRDELQEMIEYYDGYDFIGVSEDSILFSLHLLGAHRPNDKLMEELRTELSSILISKEKLQEILESK